MNSNPILFEYERRAPHYSGRTPYVEKFIRETLVSEQITRVHSVLDLCTGRGEIASIISNLADHIDAIDGAKNMLSMAREIPNVTYYLMDLNTIQFREFCSGKQYNLVTIGRGAHFLDPSTLSHLRNCINDNGKMVTFNSRADKSNSWLSEYNQVLSKFGIGRRSTNGRGHRNLLDAGYSLTRTCQRVFNVNVSVEYISKLGLSYSENEIALKHIEEFNQEMRQRMTAFLNKGMLDFRLVNSVEFYHPQ